MKADTIIVGSGLAGITCALSLPDDHSVILITKKEIKDCNSYLAQGGICVKRNEEDRNIFIEDTLKAGHYKNNQKAVEIMVDESQDAINSLIEWGVEFDKDGDHFDYTKEGGHRINRILHCKDHSGAVIMDQLIKLVSSRSNIKIIENCEMTDLLVKDNRCFGVVSKTKQNNLYIYSKTTVIATGGIGGLFKNSTNYRHITGDGLLVAQNYNVSLEGMDLVQIHPTSFYEQAEDRRFLISESVRGEGAVLLNNRREEFVDSLLPRDVVTKAILEEMKIEKTDHVWLDTSKIDVKFEERFPSIFDYVFKRGIDPRNEGIPVVPGQHFFMGGIKTDVWGKTSMENLYAIGETANTGVHGYNRLASNSLLECVVFGKRTAKSISNYKFDHSLPIEYEKNNNYNHRDILEMLNGRN